MEQLIRIGTTAASGLVFIFSIVGLATPMLTYSDDTLSLKMSLWSVTVTVTVSFFGFTNTFTETLSASDMKGDNCSTGEKMQASEAFGILLLLVSIVTVAFCTFRVASHFMPNLPKIEGIHPLVRFTALASTCVATLFSLIVFAIFAGLKSCANLKSSLSFGAGWVMYLLAFLLSMGIAGAESFSLFVLKNAPAPPALPLSQPMMAVHPPPPAQPVYQPQQQIYEPPPPQPVHKQQEADDL